MVLEMPLELYQLNIWPGRKCVLLFWLVSSWIFHSVRILSYQFYKSCWLTHSFLLAICPQGCRNNGACVAPGICSCPAGWVGGACHLGRWLLLFFVYPFLYLFDLLVECSSLQCLTKLLRRYVRIVKESCCCILWILQECKRSSWLFSLVRKTELFHLK